MWPMSYLSLFLGLMAAIAAIAAGRAFWGTRTIRKDAQQDYTYKHSRGMIDHRLSEDGYKRAYMRFYGPRKYIFMARPLHRLRFLRSRCSALSARP